MSINSLNNMVSGAAPSEEFTITLMTWMKTNWPTGGALGDTNLIAGNITFDTKFQNLSKKRAIVFEQFPQSTPPGTLGGLIVNVTETKRIQVWVSAANLGVAKAEKWKLEQQLLSMVNANPRALIPNGVREMWMDNFTQIPTDSDGAPSKGQAQESLIARSSAQVHMYYEMVRV